MLSNIIDDATAFSAQDFDFVIVGGGTAGLVLASRLSEDPHVTVGVLEAGANMSDDPLVASAGGWLATVYSPAYSWGFETSPQVHANDKVFNLPRGKLLGGCSAMNALMWTRASKHEYDAIAALGNPGWDFEGLLPYFKKAQAHTPQENAIIPNTGNVTVHQGTDGPVKTSFNTWYSSLIPPFVEAAEQLSFKLNDDPNGGTPTGVSNVARAVDGEKGTREHAAVTYLKQAQGRSNLCVLAGAHATKIVLAPSNDGVVAQGVEFLSDGVSYTVKAKREVILASGAYGSPQLLELSGIGKPKILNQFGIDSVIDLPVGENLQDHLMISLNFTLSPEAQSALTVIPISDTIENIPGKDAKSTSTGGPFLFSSLSDVSDEAAYAELVTLLDGYINSDQTTPLERAQFTIEKRWLDERDRSISEAEVMFANLPGAAGVPLPDGSMSLWLPICHLHPKSRGHVHLSSSDPTAKPAIDHNYLSREYDIKALVQLLRFMQTLSKTGPLGAIVTGIVDFPAVADTDESLTTWIRANITTIFHPVGSTAMAPKDLGGVVDPELLVYGTTNLRVVDAGIIPLQIGATPMATVYAIAEKVVSNYQRSPPDTEPFG
ncbi:hypothetical protein ONZ45_g11940 [Pleurotus djamor]|nr:hypothetical protein ONZ45_g11940 [Pleurotus djamor]